IGSDDLARGVYTVGIGIGQARSVQCGIAAIIKQEAMVTAGIAEVSDDLGRSVNRCGPGFQRTGHVERGVAALIEQEAVTMVGIIPVMSHDLARGVYTVRLGIV